MHQLFRTFSPPSPSAESLLCQGLEQASWAEAEAVLARGPETREIPAAQVGAPTAGSAPQRVRATEQQSWNGPERGPSPHEEKPSKEEVAEVSPGSPEVKVFSPL